MAPGKPHATEPDRDGSGHGDQRQSAGGGRGGEQVRDGSRGHGARRGRRQATERGRDQPCRPITTRRRPELTPEMPHERCKETHVIKLQPESHCNLRSKLPSIRPKPLILLTKRDTYDPPTGSGKGSGKGRGATLRKPGGFRARQVFLRLPPSHPPGRVAPLEIVPPGRVSPTSSQPHRTARTATAGSAACAVGYSPSCSLTVRAMARSFVESRPSLGLSVVANRVLPFSKPLRSYQ